MSMGSGTIASNDYLNKISECLYVGGIQSSETHWNEFGLIVNCTKHIPFHKNCTSEQIRIPINDNIGECDRLLEIMKKTCVLQRMNECIIHEIPVLVHCHAGSQRSCALVACYLMKYNDMTLDQAMNYVRKHRPIAFFGGANFLSSMQKFDDLAEYIQVRRASE